MNLVGILNESLDDQSYSDILSVFFFFFFGPHEMLRNIGTKTLGDSLWVIIVFVSLLCEDTPQIIPTTFVFIFSLFSFQIKVYFSTFIYFHFMHFFFTFVFIYLF